MAPAPTAQPTPVPGPGGGLLPPRASADGTLRRLLEVALVQFAERGYHGVSVRDITRAVGVKPSSLYAHLPSKEHLLAELMRLGHEEHRDQLRSALLAAGSDPEAQLRAVVRAHVSFHATYPLLATVGNSELHALSGDSLLSVLALRKEAVDILTAVIDRGVGEGTFTCPDPWLATAAIGAMGIRVAAWFRPVPAAAAIDDDYAEQVRAWYPHRPYTIEEVADAYADFALRVVR